MKTDDEAAERGDSGRVAEYVEQTHTHRATRFGFDVGDVGNCGDVVVVEAMLESENGSGEQREFESFWREHWIEDSSEKRKPKLEKRNKDNKFVAVRDRATGDGILRADETPRRGIRAGAIGSAPDARYFIGSRSGVADVGARSTRVSDGETKFRKH